LPSAKVVKKREKKLNSNETSARDGQETENQDPPSMAGIVFLLLGAGCAFVAALNALFHFAPPFVFGVAAAVSMLIGTQLLKR
jgi:hypothetical protein